MIVYWTSFLGGLAGGVLITIYHMRRYNRMVDQVVKGIAGLNAYHDEIVRGLIERIKQLEGDRREH